MKTPPIQQKKAVAPQQQDAAPQENEGKSMAPPAFQLKASASPIQRQAELRTITDAHAYLREGPPKFAPQKNKIAQGTRVEVLEEQALAGKKYIRVKDHDAGTELGWTSKGNVEDLDKKYKNAGSTYVYHVDGHDLLVFVPKDGLKVSNPNVFLFFHGRGADYTTSKTHAKSGGFEDNPALGTDMAGLVNRSGGIAIMPQGHGFKVDQDWGAQGPGKFKAMVDTAMTHLSQDLGLADKPLTPGNISLAGHSAGGNALGQAAQDTGATDVTLQEAGYNFTPSWIKMRDWFLTGQSPKTVRVITQNNGNGTATRALLKDAKKVDGKWQAAGAFKASEIVAYSKELVKEGKLAGPVTIEEFQGDGKVEAGEIVLERGYRVMRSDGSLLGSLRLYHLEDPEADHWASVTKTMEATMGAGAKDRAADKAATKK